jgi:hypothetical protein
LLDSPLDHPRILDELWSAYIETKNIEFVQRIISVLDLSDRVRERLNTWLQQTTLREYSRYQQQLAKWSFPIDFTNRSVGGPVDMDLHVALLAKRGQLKFSELPVQIPMEDQIHLAMKSAALWSLLSMSREDPNVADICRRESRIVGGVARSHLALASNE